MSFNMDHIGALPKSMLHLGNAEKTIIAGGVAGVVAKTCTAPLSRMTILYQINSFATAQRGSLLTSCLRVYREEGLASFWRGNLTSCIHRFPYSAINFTVFSALERVISSNVSAQGSSSTRLLCGAAAGAVACVACYPLDLIRTRLTVQSSDHYRGIAHGLRLVVREEGLLGLYKGLGLSLAVCVPSLAISFSVYGTLKQSLEARRWPELHARLVDPASRKLNVFGSCFAGAVSGLSASLLLFPFDVVRRRLQVRGMVPRQTRHGARHEVARILRTDGARGLYRGLLPELLKVCPMVGMQFTIYEYVLRTLGGLNKQPA